MKWKINLNDSVYIVAEKTDAGITISGYPKGIEELIISRVRGNRVYFALEDRLFACVNMNEESVYYLRKEPFTTTDIRNAFANSRQQHSVQEVTFYSENNREFKEERTTPEVTIKTELHTHFLEMLTGREFLDLMGEFTKYVPVRDGIIPGKLQKGEFLEDFSKEDISYARGLSDTDVEKIPYTLLCSQLSIDVSGQVPFETMEETSTRRTNVITIAARELAKTLGMDPLDFQKVAECRAIIYIKMLEKSLKTLKDHDIEYVEFSYSTKNTIIKMMDYIRKHPEKFSGIDFNILFSFSRNVKKASGVEKSLVAFKDLVDQSYVKGFDLMGQENGLTFGDITDLNDQRSFISIIKKVLEIMDGREDLVLRLHAGENYNSRNNPLESLRVIDKLYEEMKCGKTLPEIRLGHGLHFAETYTEEELAEYADLLQRYKVIVEINATSNFTLSNITNLQRLPYRWYVANKIQIVLATDGAGMYLTDAIQEKMLANIFGGEGTLDNVLNTENGVLRR